MWEVLQADLKPQPVNVDLIFLASLQEQVDVTTPTVIQLKIVAEYWARSRVWEDAFRTET